MLLAQQQCNTMSLVESCDSPVLVCAHNGEDHFDHIISFVQFLLYYYDIFHDIISSVLSLFNSFSMNNKKPHTLQLGKIRFLVQLFTV